MNLDEFKRKWKAIAEEEVAMWEDTAEHDLDFAISYKDIAHSNYRALLDDLEAIK